MTIALLAQRLDRLERQIRFWRILTVFLASLFVAVLVSRASAKPLRIDATAVVAEEFDLANPDGRIMARLVPDPADSNAPSLVLKYPNNKAGVMIGVSDVGALVTLFNTDGHSRASLIESAAGPSLNLFDEEGKLRILVHAKNNKPEITVFDKSITKKLWNAPSTTSK